MEPITGTGSGTLQPLRSAPAAPPHTYFGVAQGLMPGVTVLAAASPLPAMALALVCAHVLECLLKAYLSLYVSEKELKKLGHDLNALWNRSVERGLLLPAPSFAPSSGARLGQTQALKRDRGIPFSPDLDPFLIRGFDL